MTLIPNSNAARRWSIQCDRCRTQLDLGSYSPRLPRDWWESSDGTRHFCPQCLRAIQPSRIGHDSSKRSRYGD